MATYPVFVVNFTTHKDGDVVASADPNTIQDEVTALETTLGSMPHVSTANSSGGTYANSAHTYPNVASRLANIEQGIVSDAHSQYVHVTGGDTIAPPAGTIGLTVKAPTTPTTPVFQVVNNAGAPVLYVDSALVPRVLGGAAVVDTSSAQTLTNKTLSSPTTSGVVTETGTHSPDTAAHVAMSVTGLGASQAGDLLQVKNNGSILVNVTSDGSLAVGFNQLFSTTQALALTTGAFFQASGVNIRPVVIRGATSQVANLAEFQRQDTAVGGGLGPTGLLFQNGVPGASAGTSFVNNNNNADLSFKNSGDGLEYVRLGVSTNRFIAVGTGNTPMQIWQFSSGQTGDLTAWQTTNGAATIARVSSTGNVQGTGAYTTLSDAAAKKNIHSLVLDPVAVIKALRPVHYDYRNGESDQVGFVAQEVAAALPHAVVPFDSNRLGLRSEAILAYLVAAVQTLLEPSVG